MYGYLLSTTTTFFQGRTFPSRHPSVAVFHGTVLPFRVLETLIPLTRTARTGGDGLQTRHRPSRRPVVTSHGSRGARVRPRRPRREPTPRHLPRAHSPKPCEATVVVLVAGVWRYRSRRWTARWMFLGTVQASREPSERRRAARLGRRVRRARPRRERAFRAAGGVGNG